MHSAVRQNAQSVSSINSSGSLLGAGLFGGCTGYFRDKAENDSNLIQFPFLPSGAIETSTAVSTAVS